MTLGQAWREALQGRGITRQAWRGSRPPVRITRQDAEDVLGLGKPPAMAAGANLDSEDLTATDWTVVADA